MCASRRRTKWILRNVQNNYRNMTDYVNCQVDSAFYPPWYGKWVSAFGRNRAYRNNLNIRLATHCLQKNVSFLLKKTATGKQHPLTAGFYFSERVWLTKVFSKYGSGWSRLTRHSPLKMKYAPLTTLYSPEAIIVPHHIIWSWYAGHWWVGCYIWYSEVGPGRGGAQPSSLLAVPNVTAHQSMASVPITVLLYNSPWLCKFNVGIKGLNNRNKGKRDKHVTCCSHWTVQTGHGET